MSTRIPKYNVLWEPSITPLAMEIQCIRMGGQWKKKNGDMAGLGLFYHVQQAQMILWPEKKWHKWNILELECYLEYRIIGELGPASSGKTFSAATNLLMDYYCYPECTTGLVSSTTRESLEMRVWGEIKKMHRIAKSRFSWLPGHLIEGRQRIVTDGRTVASEGRDFRNGIVGVACKKGQNFQGLGEYVGIKNKRLRLVGDELQFLPRGYIDAVANLNKNPDFKMVGLGNPKETTDALGVLCEPSGEIGGWDSGIDQTSKTKTWVTRFDKGICLQLPGSDSPNLDGNLGIPLISQKDIDADIQFYGKDSLQYTMMDEGRMPRGQGLRRVLTRNFCLKFGAMEEPVWDSNKLTKVGFLDAAYRGVGGDRCVFGQLNMGKDINGRQIMALAEVMVVPVNAALDEPAEDQIADFVKTQCAMRAIPPEHFFFDSTGRGTLVSAFARLWDPHVGTVEFGGPPTERRVSTETDKTCDQFYSKFVSELWFSVRLVVESGQFRGMTDEVMNEGCMREWKIVKGNKIEVETKEEMKIKSGRSPDLFDALAAGVEGCRRLGFVITKLGSVMAKKVDRNWKQLLEEKAANLHKSKDLVYSGA